MATQKKEDADARVGILRISIIQAFDFAACLLLAAATTSYLLLELLFEGLELRSELGEEGIVGVFLDDVMHETHREDELLGVLVFGEAKAFVIRTPAAPGWMT